jgi:hypothetical protein
LRLHLSHLAIIVLTLNKFLWLKFEVFTGSPIHPPPSRCSQLRIRHLFGEAIQVGDEGLGLDDGLSALHTFHVALVSVAVRGADGDDSVGGLAS